MEIKYIWSAKSNDPKEITSITVKSEYIPRIGELVDIELNISKEEKCIKSGRVEDVWWHIKATSYVTIRLGS